MTEPADQPAKPLRTWRPMAAWTGAILLALGLVWSVPAVVLPFLHARTMLRDYGTQSFRQWSSERGRRLVTAQIGPPQRARLGLRLNLHLSSLTAEQRLTALRLLGYCGKCALPDLLEAFAGDDQDVRRAAALAIGDVGPDAASAVPVLTRALADDNISVRFCAMRALGKIGPEAKAAVPLLIPVLADTDSSHESFADCAAEALGGIGPESIPSLLQLLAAKDRTVRRRAIWALGLIGPPARDALPALEEILKEGNDMGLILAVSNALMRIRREEPPK